MLVHPDDLFDREQEWRDLDTFVSSNQPGLRVGIVYGRRRTGKSYLLRRLARNGLYVQALEEEKAPALLRFSGAIAERSELPVSAVRFTDWLDLLRAILRSKDPPRLVVIDEFPYLLRHSPELPSVIQLLCDEQTSGTPLRLILCGSSLSVMSELLSGTKPLRGRATLDMKIAPFDFRISQSFWKVRDPETALAVDAVLGGAPGYRDLASSEVPSRSRQLEAWLTATVLNPSHALYREDEFLLREDPRLTDRAMYQSILAAIAAGEHTPSRIGGRLGKDRTALHHALDVLRTSGFIRKDEDLFSARKPTYEVVDPIVRFCQLIVAPNRALLDERQGSQVWRESVHTWRARILGPHFEQVCREWLSRYAKTRTIGGRWTRIGRALLNDRNNKAVIELDAVCADASGKVLAIGESKSSEQLCQPEELQRLERARVLLGDRAHPRARLILMSRKGFAKGLRQAARGRSDVELVDLERLYADA